MSIQQLTQHCSHCGQELRASASFCDACGQPLSAVPQGTSATTTPPSSLQNGQPTVVATPSPGGIGWRLPQQPAATPTSKPMKPPSSTVQSMAQPQSSTGGQPGIVGEVRGIQQRNEQDPYINEWTWNIWTFRVERYDPAGNRLPPVAVEMRSRFFEGAINEGDWVEIPGVWQGSETLRPPSVFNITTGTVVKAKTKPPISRGSKITWSVAGILFLAIFWGIALAAVLLVRWIGASVPDLPPFFSVLPLMFVLMAVLVTVVAVAFVVTRRRDNDHS